MAILYYDGPADNLVCFKTNEELEAWQDDQGMFGGEFEQDTETGLYRCPDWDNSWKAFATAAEAAEYYNSLAF